MSQKKPPSLAARRRKTDLSEGDIESRLKGLHGLVQSPDELDRPEPDYLIRGKPFWIAASFESWFERYLSDLEVRVQAHTQLLECEEARLRDQHRRADEADLRAAQSLPGSLQWHLANLKNDGGKTHGQ